MTDYKLTPREPTDAMVLAGDAALPDNPDEHDAVSVWRAMHDAAPDDAQQRVALARVLTDLKRADALLREILDAKEEYRPSLLLKAYDAARAYLRERGYE